MNEELRLFKSRHPDRPVIPLIVDGEPGNSEKECFPPALRLSVAPDGAVTDAPVDVLAADLRERGDGIELALAKVVARLIGLAPDDVYRRADRERRRQARRTRRVQALIYVLLVGIIGGLIGWINQAYVEEQWNWFTTMRPYMLANIRPYVLTADAERALKAMASFRECAKDCPEMIVIPAGRFTMGSPAGEQGRYVSSPQHAITIAEPFGVSEFDVTFADWDACVSVGGCLEVGDSGMGRGTTPAVNINWDEALQYVTWLSKMTGQPYRLLTEAEWEYAARAGSTTAYYWGDEIGKGNADCNGCGSKWDYLKASPVGSFKPNAFGLYDMAGDVWQWLQDCFHDDYKGAPADGSRRDLALPATLAKLDRYDALILDDLGYVRKDQAETTVLFELIAERYERRSLIVTCNQPFSEWNQTFPDPAMTVAAIDRIVHHATIIECNTESYRRRAAVKSNASSPATQI